MKGDKCKHKGCDGCTYPKECIGTRTCTAYNRANVSRYAEENLEKIQEKSKRVYELNKESIDKRNLENYYKNHEQRLVQHADYRKDRKENHRIEMYITSTLYNHKRRGCDIQITKEEAIEKLESTKVCRYCGKKLVFSSTKKGIREGVSLDRMDNNLVLTTKNTQFICHRCNSTKGDRTHEEFIAYIRCVLELND